MQCSWIRPNLLSYHDGLLPAWQRRLVEAHFTHCPQCRTEYEQLAATDRRLHQLGRAAAEPKAAAVLEQELLQRIDAISAQEAGQRQRALTGLLQTPASQVRTGRRLLAVAALVICLLYLMPQVTPIAADMPVIGPWVKKSVLSNAGLKWAYDNGCVLQEPIKMEQDGYQVTVLGYMADPVQTAVIMLLNEPAEQRGEKSAELSIHVPNSVVWSGIPEQTPLGKLFVVWSTPLPFEGAEVEVVLHARGEQITMGQTLFITPESIARVSTEQPLDHVVETADYRLTVDRLVVTPAQFRLDITYPDNLQMAKAPQLVTDQGIVLSDSYGLARGDGTGNWHRSLVFDRGHGEPQALRFEQLLLWQQLPEPAVIPAGSDRTVSLAGEGWSIDVRAAGWPGGSVVQPTVQAEDEKWQQAGFNFAISVAGHGYPGYAGHDLVKWQLRTADDRVLQFHQLTSAGYSVSNPDNNGEYVVHLRLPDDLEIQAIEVVSVAVPCDPIAIDLK